MTAWLSIIGVGCNGISALAPEAKSYLARAKLIAGSSRLLNTLDAPDEKKFPWPSPFSAGVEKLLSLRGQPVTVLATGDPMHFGVGATLARHIPAEEMIVFPAPSAFSLAAGRLGWALQDVACISLHARSIETLHLYTQPGARLIVLTNDGAAPSLIMGALSETGFGASKVHVLENLGGTEERVTMLTANDGAAAKQRISDLNTLAINCVTEPGGNTHTCVPGLPDDAFLHDGQLTKREVRAITLSALAPTYGERLWDVGAGCGSVAIEWLRAGKHVEATAFERQAARVDMIRQNAARLGVPHVEVVEGDLPDTLKGQRAPDAVFIGGAVASDTLFDACWSALHPGGRLVSNAVTLEGEAALIARHKVFGGNLTRIDISRVTDIGQLRSMRPAMPVLQWHVVKPVDLGGCT